VFTPVILELLFIVKVARSILIFWPAAVGIHHSVSAEAKSLSYALAGTT
jgi:hypothetical protein